MNPNCLLTLLKLAEDTDITEHLEIFNADETSNLAAALDAFHFYLYKVSGGEPYNKTGSYHILSDKELTTDQVKECLGEVLGAKYDVKISLIAPKHFCH